jgi:16S rRNA (guanine966-N2)-methyltransferase
VRVVAGSARGRRLVAPKGDLVRPTSDRVKESVFNALTSLDVLEGSVVVDLFAGSGALGIEALSRGARLATFVDDHPRSIAAVRANLSATDVADRARVVRADVLAFLDRSRPDDRRAAVGETRREGGLEEAPGVVFADPPYRYDRWAELLAALARWTSGPASRGPSADGPEGALLAVLESDRELVAPAGWGRVRSRTYGSTVMTFLQFRRAGSNDVSGDVAGRTDGAEPDSARGASAADATRGQEE